VKTFDIYHNLKSANPLFEKATSDKIGYLFSGLVLINFNFKCFCKQGSFVFLSVVQLENAFNRNKQGWACCNFYFLVVQMDSHFFAGLHYYDITRKCHDLELFCLYNFLSENLAVE